MSSQNMKVRRRGRNYRVEILLDNYVDKDVQRLIKPFDLTQTVTCYPMYCIKNNFITPNSRLSTIFSFFVTVVVIFIQHYSGISRPGVACVNTWGYIVYFIVGFKYSVHHIKFVLNIQDLHRFFNDNASFRRYTFWTWMTIIADYIWSTAQYIEIQYNRKLSFKSLANIILVVFDYRIIYCARYIKLLELELSLWNDYALKSQELENADTCTELHNQKLFEAFVKIFECYDLYKEVFRHTVSKTGTKLYTH